ncbi:putative phosphotransferase enzyme family protein [Botrytis fragariae]|uniref:protein-ribulosamine 3-kinase n=1 Tax=Botrytis fragariae TaxID=1964551 RepID=A0A8H6EH15_9HELO|nr:putative phosphotransferase enzyme family protein [Botrytis fragariae]KAF5871923.1 putative phosphotransferase enzyme family protein [Botrytis fragariae]
MEPSSALGNDLDPHILAELPEVQKVLQISGLGVSAWATKSRISTLLKDGTNQDYYLKTTVGDLGRAAINGEFESMKAIQKVMPGFIASPIAQGSMKNEPECHFYLGRYLPIIDELVEPSSFCEQIARLHRSSVSPNNKFGFHTVTFNGDLPQKNDYSDSWESFFADGFRHMLDINTARAGPSEELEALLPAFFEKVIPRLLRPLEGRIKPSLVHGDMWYGNAGVNTLEDEAVIFDPGCFYAHNEYELGNWRPERNKFSKAYFNAYHAHIPKASPEEDYEDRIALYSLRFNLHAASLFPTVLGFRESLIQDMKYLVEKYPEGLSSDLEV